MKKTIAFPLLDMVRQETESVPVSGGLQKVQDSSGTSEGGSKSKTDLSSKSWSTVFDGDWGRLFPLFSQPSGPLSLPVRPDFSPLISSANQFLEDPFNMSVTTRVAQAFLQTLAYPLQVGTVLTQSGATKTIPETFARIANIGGKRLLKEAVVPGGMTVVSKFAQFFPFDWTKQHLLTQGYSEERANLGALGVATFSESVVQVLSERAVSEFRHHPCVLTALRDGVFKDPFKAFNGGGAMYLRNFMGGVPILLGGNLADHFLTKVSSFVPVPKKDDGSFQFSPKLMAVIGISSLFYALNTPLDYFKQQRMSHPDMGYGALFRRVMDQAKTNPNSGKDMVVYQPKNSVFQFLDNLRWGFKVATNAMTTMNSGAAFRGMRGGVCGAGVYVGFEGVKQLQAWTHANL